MFVGGAGNSGPDPGRWHGECWQFPGHALAAQPGASELALRLLNSTHMPLSLPIPNSSEYALGVQNPYLTPSFLLQCAAETRPAIPELADLVRDHGSGGGDSGVGGGSGAGEGEEQEADGGGAWAIQSPGASPRGAPRRASLDPDRRHVRPMPGPASGFLVSAVRGTQGFWQARRGCRAASLDRNCQQVRLHFMTPRVWDFGCVKGGQQGV